jgi:hypothetical protein
MLLYQDLLNPLAKQNADSGFERPYKSHYSEVAAMIISAILGRSDAVTSISPKISGIASCSRMVQYAPRNL